MKLGILKAGGPPPGLARFGSYPAMFRKLLGEQAFAYRTYDVEAGELPPQPSACAAYIVTGSACGVYDPLPWIARLKHFLNEAKGKAALVGICFGHQVMAEAFGGKVVKSPKGWGMGAMSYEVVRPQPWLDNRRKITLPASHQDQVVLPPPGAAVVASSDFAPYGLLAYRDQPAMSLQLHPEFTEDYAIALTEGKRGTGPSDVEIDAAIASLHEPMDHEFAAECISSFLRSPGAR